MPVQARQRMACSSSTQGSRVCRRRNVQGLGEIDAHGGGFQQELRELLPANLCSLVKECQREEGRLTRLVVMMTTLTREMRQGQSMMMSLMIH